MIFDTDILSMLGKNDFVDDVLEQGFKVIHLDSELINEYEQKKQKLRNIHAGELTSILLCKRDGIAFATNDGKAKRFCEESNVEWLDIVDILRLCYRKRVLDKREIENVIKDIEEKDRTRITRKGEIFADAV